MGQGTASIRPQTTGTTWYNRMALAWTIDANPRSDVLQGIGKWWARLRDDLPLRSKASSELRDEEHSMIGGVISADSHPFWPLS